MKVAFIGLGVMGYPMAGHLKKAGNEVTVYNRNPEKAKQWVAEFGGTSVATPADAAKGQEIVFACVGRDSDLREVTIGDPSSGSGGAFGAMEKGALFVDHTTASAGIARELYAEAKKRGFDFIDAPVSGGQAGAVNGKLGIMCGGDEAPYAKAEAAMVPYTKLAKRLGPAGAGQLTKMANQICIAGIVQGLAEAYSLMRAAGLDIENVTDVISKGAAQSWQMENRVKTMNADEYNHGFAVEWMRKDLGIALEEARRQGVSLPMTAMVDQFYAEVENWGGKRWDTSSLFVRQEHARKGTKS
jgi:3-hydroxyisobutyrate dehydrogenase